MEAKQEIKTRGLRLLKKGQKGLARVIFSRTGFITLLLFLNIFLFASFHLWLRDLIPPGLMQVISFSFIVGMVIYLLNSDMDPTSKITWLILMAVVPTVGAPLYFYVQADWGHRNMKRLVAMMMKKTKSALPQRSSTLERLREKAPEELPLWRYLQKVGNQAVCDQCQIRYFSSGEAKFEALKEELQKAKRFIFLEYFIVDEGRMWGEVLEILAEKARKGVEVRLMYDGSCEFTTLTRDYPERLNKLASSAASLRRRRPWFPPTTTTATTARSLSLTVRWPSPAASIWRTSTSTSSRNTATGRMRLSWSAARRHAASR